MVACEIPFLHTLDGRLRRLPHYRDDPLCARIIEGWKRSQLLSVLANPLPPHTNRVPSCNMVDVDPERAIFIGAAGVQERNLGLYNSAVLSRWSVTCSPPVTSTWPSPIKLPTPELRGTLKGPVVVQRLLFGWKTTAVLRSRSCRSVPPASSTEPSGSRAMVGRIRADVVPAARQELERGSYVSGPPP